MESKAYHIGGDRYKIRYISTENPSVESQTSGENMTKKRGASSARWVLELMPRSSLITGRKACFSWFLLSLLATCKTYF